MWLLQYAENAQGTLIHISEAARGASGLVCPGCRGAIVAKKGKIKVAHFSHLKETCQAQETYDFLSVRESISTRAALAQFALKKQQNIHNTHRELLAEAREKAAFYSHVFTAMTEAKNRLATVAAPKAKDKMLQKNHQVLERLTTFLEDEKQALPVLSMVCDPDESCRYYEYSWGQRGYEYSKEGCLLNEIPKSAKAIFVAEWLKEAYKYISLYHHYRKDHEHASEQLAFFEQEKARFDQFRLYFLGITLPGEKLIHKVGITARALEERIREIRYDLRQFGEVKITVLYDLTNCGFIEHYFKQKYKEARFPFESHTEYFEFSKEQVLLLHDQFKKIHHNSR